MGIAGWFGFDVLVSEQSSLGLLGLHISVSWLPALLVGVAMFFVAMMPINGQRMVIIRKRLAELDERRSRSVEKVPAADVTFAE